MADHDVESLQDSAIEDDEDTEGNRRFTRVVLKNDEADEEDTEGNRRFTRVVLKNDEGEDDEDTEGNRRKV